MIYALYGRLHLTGQHAGPLNRRDGGAKIGGTVGPSGGARRAVSWLYLAGLRVTIMRVPKGEAAMVSGNAGRLSRIGVMHLSLYLPSTGSLNARGCFTLGHIFEFACGTLRAFLGADDGQRVRFFVGSDLYGEIAADTHGNHNRAQSGQESEISRCGSLGRKSFQPVMSSPRPSLSVSALSMLPTSRNLASSSGVVRPSIWANFSSSQRAARNEYLRTEARSGWSRR